MSLLGLAMMLAQLAAPVDRVVMISIDGLRADAIDAAAPTLKRLIAEGASTLDARIDPTRPFTVPNHLCMVTGRPTLGRDGHKYTLNKFGGPSVHQNAGRYLPSVFDVVHDHGGSVLMLTAKKKLGQFGTWWGPRQGAPDRVPPSHGPGKIDRVFVEDTGAFIRDDAALAAGAVSIMQAQPPTLMFLHFAAPDRAGHLAGWDSSPGTHYHGAVATTDALVGLVIAGLAPRTLVLVTSDHGGVGRGHGDLSDPRVHTIPFIAWGAGVAPGTDLYALNPPRGPKNRPIRNCMLGNTALAALRLPLIPGAPAPAMLLR
ncbi:MAG: putative AlkP superfamily pyrophosphatase or phosphodiesterase [Bradymonadia bacterium]|jgi:predicted AlkP superfamily pyrophosphatase or phosphodiesterase